MKCEIKKIEDGNFLICMIHGISSHYVPLNIYPMDSGAYLIGSAPGLREEEPNIEECLKNISEYGKKIGWPEK